MFPSVETSARMNLVALFVADMLFCAYLAKREINVSHAGKTGNM